MSGNPFFSIVVSACDVAPYVPELIASIKAQSCGDFEALVYQEESSDGTAEALRRAIGDDARFTVFAGPRSGSASVGRNWGVERSAGRYVVFLDGDDCLKPDALENFSRAVEQFGELDIIGGKAELRWELPGVAAPADLRLGHTVPVNRVLPAAAALATMLRSDFRPAVWYQIYRGALLRNDASLRQAPGRRHQDEEWTPRVFLAAERFLELPTVFYVYRKRGNSVTTRFSERSITDCTDNVLSYLSYWRTHEIPAAVRRELADWQIGLFIRNFHRAVFAGAPRTLRRAEFGRTFRDGADWRTFRRMARLSRFSKKLLIPILALGRCGGFGGAEWIFEHLYWPAIFTVRANVKKWLRR